MARRRPHPRAAREALADAPYGPWRLTAVTGPAVPDLAATSTYAGIYTAMSALGVSAPDADRMEPWQIADAVAAWNARHAPPGSPGAKQPMAVLPSTLARIEEFKARKGRAS